MEIPVKMPKLRDILRIALPMVASQASETIMMFVDRLFLSKLGKMYISSAMSGGLTTFVFFSFFMGIVGYVNAIVAQYYGAGKRSECSRVTFQGIYLSFLFYPLLLLLIPFGKFLFAFTGHIPEQVVLEFSYFRILMFGGILALIRSTLAGFFIGIGKTRIVMIANITGMFVNIPVNWMLIFGKFGFPALGMEGAAIGTVCGSLAITLFLSLAFISGKNRQVFMASSMLKTDISLLKKLLRFGIPAGTETFLNVAAFNIFLQLMHSYSPDVAAAVTITFNWDLVAFIPMLGLGFATTALVGQQIGAKNIEGARHATYLSLRVAWVYSGSMMLLFIFGAGPLVSVFAGGFGAADAGVVPLAVILLRLASVYTLADATQLVFAGALRGAGDTAFVMKISTILHWIMAVVSWILIKVLVVSPVLVWIWFIVFVLIIGVSMFLRFKRGRWEKIKLIGE